jgi:hypothetical protein
MFAGVDLARPHAFATRLHAVGGPRARVSGGAVQDRVRARFGAHVDARRGLLLEEWRSDATPPARRVFESRVAVRGAVALVSAASVRHDGEARAWVRAPWDDDGVAAYVVRLPRRTTGTLHLRCVAAPFGGARPAFRLALRCEGPGGWRTDVALP